MSSKPLIQWNNPKLTSDNQQVTEFTTPFLSQLLQDLTDTMRHTNLVGIAAPQIGENFQVFITEPRATQFRTKDQTDILRVYVNPKITNLSQEEVVIYEGCGSVDAIGFFGPVTRAKEVTVEAFDEQGRKFRLSTDGLLARIIQHEYDHLQGKIFLEHVHDKSKLLSYEDYIKFKKTDPNIQKLSKITKLDFCILPN